jgi:hypothetical protein
MYLRSVAEDCRSFRGFPRGLCNRGCEVGRHNSGNNWPRSDRTKVGRGSGVVNRVGDHAGSKFPEPGAIMISIIASTTIIIIKK